MRVLLLRLEADVMSFTEAVVDQYHRTGSWPRRSMLTGFLANALGLLTSDISQLEIMQRRLRYAVRIDRRGSRFSDYHVVDHRSKFVNGVLLSPNGWLKGINDPDKQKLLPGSRERISGASYLVALTFVGGEYPSLDEVAEALQHPKRILFVGTRSNVLSKPPFEGIVEAPSLVYALEETLPKGATNVPAIWPENEGGNRSSHIYPVSEDRDWVNDIVVGHRMIREGVLCPG